MEVIRQVHTLGASIMGFTGGEPCVRMDLTELVQAASSGGAATILFTSGYGFDAPLADRLRRAGLWSVCVSLDAATAAIHDARRGAGAFDMAIAALRLARKSGFYTMAGAVATPAFVNEGMADSIHRLLGDLGVHELRIVEAMPCGRLTDCAGSELLTPEQVKRLRHVHVETNRAGRGPKICAFNHIESPEIFGCGAGTQHLYIEPSGIVCPCDFTPLGFGNVRETPLVDLWLRMNRAMGDNPRQHCFIQKNRDRIRAEAVHGYPLPPDLSEALCRAAGTEPLPAYFALVTSGGTGLPGKEPPA
jgi:MoaA/NifB/PqqE/SkfB family radical SAM enzyme